MAVTEYKYSQKFEVTLQTNIVKLFLKQPCILSVVCTVVIAVEPVSPDLAVNNRVKSA